MEVRKCLYCIPYFLIRITNCKGVSENNAKPFFFWNLSREYKNVYLWLKKKKTSLPFIQ